MTDVKGPADRWRWGVYAKNLISRFGSLEFIDAFLFPSLHPFGLKSIDRRFFRNLRHADYGIGRKQLVTGYLINVLRKLLFLTKFKKPQ
jgi:hypothetical protein